MFWELIFVWYLSVIIWNNRPIRRIPWKWLLLSEWTAADFCIAGLRHMIEYLYSDTGELLSFLNDKTKHQWLIGEDWSCFFMTLVTIRSIKVEIRNLQIYLILTPVLWLVQKRWNPLIYQNLWECHSFCINCQVFLHGMYCSCYILYTVCWVSLCQFQHSSSMALKANQFNLLSRNEMIPMHHQNNLRNVLPLYACPSKKNLKLCFLDSTSCKV